MISIEQYKCEFCHTVYKDKPMCIKCENSHVEPKAIIRCRYQPNCVDRTGYPDRITIQMSDGKSVDYKR